MRVADLFFDRAAGRFFGAHTSWADEWIHDVGRRFVVSVALGALGLLAASLAATRLVPYRRAAAFVVLTMAIGPGLVTLGKQTTNIGCPRELTRYGGQRPYARLFDSRPADLPRAECFPGGHSSGAFSLVAFYFALRGLRPRAARAALAGALALGCVFSFGQWARGAHFPTHDAASALICWIAAAALYGGPFGARLWPEARAQGA